MKSSFCVVCGEAIPVTHVCLTYYDEDAEKVYVACMSHEGTPELEEVFQQIKGENHD